MLRFVRKTTLLTKCCSQTWLYCLCFMFGCITLKQCNSLSLIYSFSCLCGRCVTHQSANPEVPRSYSESDKDVSFLLFKIQQISSLYIQIPASSGEWRESHPGLISAAHDHRVHVDGRRQNAADFRKRLSYK